MTIFKYTLNPMQITKDGSIHLAIPRPAKILSVAEQHGEMVLYALVNPDASEDLCRRVWVLGTGHDLPNDLVQQYEGGTAFIVGTVKLEEGTLMFHIMAENGVAFSQCNHRYNRDKCPALGVKQ